MSISCRRAPVLWLFTLLLMSPGVAAAQEMGTKSPAARWKSTDVWDIAVQSYVAGEEKPAATYSVKVRPLGGPEGTGFQVLQFQASTDAPVQHHQTYSVWIEEASGWIGKVCQFDPKVGIPVDKKLVTLGRASVLREPVRGMPLELLLPTLRSSTITDPATKAKVELRREEKGDLVIMEMTSSLPGQAEVRVVQTWHREESWWRETARFVNGRKDLDAKRTSVGSTAEMEKLLAQDINLFLNDDKRLAVKVTFVQDHPKLQDLLEAVQSATGVSLSLAEEVNGHDPDFGSVQMRVCPAWVVMKFIASKGFGDGQWEHHNGGYRLKSRRTVPPSRRAPESPWDLLWWTGGTLLILVVVLILIRRSTRPRSHA
jgi:hypothetical protein